MQRLLICGAVGLALLFGAFASTTPPRRTTKAGVGIITITTMAAGGNTAGVTAAGGSKRPASNGILKLRRASALAGAFLLRAWRSFETGGRYWTSNQ